MGDAASARLTRRSLALLRGSYHRSTRHEATQRSRAAMTAQTFSSFTTAFTVDESPKQVFDAISNPCGWWSEDIEGGTDNVNDEFTYHAAIRAFAAPTPALCGRSAACSSAPSAVPSVSGKSSFLHQFDGHAHAGGGARHPTVLGGLGFEGRRRSGAYSSVSWRRGIAEGSAVSRRPPSAGSLGRSSGRPSTWSSSRRPRARCCAATGASGAGGAEAGARNRPRVLGVFGIRARRAVGGRGGGRVRRLT